MTVTVRRALIDILPDHSLASCENCQFTKGNGWASTWIGIMAAPEPWDSARVLQFLEGGYE